MIDALSILVLVVSHFVADFLLQSRGMATQKSKSWRVLFEHGSINMFVVFLGMLLLSGGHFSRDAATTALVISGINAVVHMAIDKTLWLLYAVSVIVRTPEIPRHKLEKDWKYWEDWWFYTFLGFDQLLHVATLILLYNFLR